MKDKITRWSVRKWFLSYCIVAFGMSVTAVFGVHMLSKPAAIFAIVFLGVLLVGCVYQMDRQAERRTPDQKTLGDYAED